MAWAPQRPCTFPGCGKLSDNSRCELHRRQERREIDERRGSAASRGYDARWQKVRRAYLDEHPMCAECAKHNRIRAAEVVDHIRAHKGDWKSFWDRNNWQALCKPCHDSKTAKVDGRWQ